VFSIPAAIGSSATGAPTENVFSQAASWLSETGVKTDMGRSPKRCDCPADRERRLQ
jgi:hypothetical protein